MADSKRMTVDRFFGDIDERLEAFRRMLAFVDTDEPDDEELVDWLLTETSAESPNAVGHRLAFLKSVGFLVETEDSYRLGDPSEMFIERDDPRPLLEGLVEHVHGFDQLLAVLEERPLSDADIRDVLAKHPDFTSDTGVAKRHREWLQMLGYVDRADKRVTLTDAGRAAADSLGEYVPPEGLDIRYMAPDGQWQLCREEGVIFLGWEAIYDLDLDDIDDGTLERKLDGDSPADVQRFLDMPVGTLLIAKTGLHKIDGIGVVTGGYERRELGADDSANVHTRPVDWIDIHAVADGAFVPDWEEGPGEQAFRNGTGPYEFGSQSYRYLREHLLSTYPELEGDIETAERTAQALQRAEHGNFDPTVRLVNQGTKAELDGEYIQAPYPQNAWQQDISRASVGDRLIHHDTTADVFAGESVLIDHGELRPGETADDDDHLRRPVRFEPFDAPPASDDILGYLNQETFIEETDYYLFNRNGVRTPGYLFDLPAAAVEYIQSQIGGPIPTRTYGDHEEALTVPDDEITVPADGLHFPAGDWDALSTRVAKALAAGKHILFFGPPGTGKTKLAKGICEATVGDDYRLTTASADWSGFDTIGGYRSGAGNALAFEPGVILECFQDDDGQPTNEWLIIDELNRADIDKAFGAMFSALTGESVTLPFETETGAVELLDASRTEEPVAEHRYYIPEDWQMIATMNTLDKTSLYEMSYAFMRRWAFIPVGVPDLSAIDERGELAELVEAYVKIWAAGTDAVVENDSHYGTVGRLWATIAAHRELGPAVVEDVYRYVADSEMPEDADYISPIVMYVFPQLEGLRRADLEQLLRNLESVAIEDEAELWSVAEDFFRMDLEREVEG